jgi:hypothetical protein
MRTSVDREAHANGKPAPGIRESFSTQSADSTHPRGRTIAPANHLDADRCRSSRRPGGKVSALKWNGTMRLCQILLQSSKPRFPELLARKCAPRSKRSKNHRSHSAHRLRSYVVKWELSRRNCAGLQKGLRAPQRRQARTTRIQRARSADSAQPDWRHIGPSSGCPLRSMDNWLVCPGRRSITGNKARRVHRRHSSKILRQSETSVRVRLRNV